MPYLFKSIPHFTSDEDMEIITLRLYLWNEMIRSRIQNGVDLEKRTSQILNLSLKFSYYFFLDNSHNFFVLQHLFLFYPDDLKYLGLPFINL